MDDPRAVLRTLLDQFEVDQGYYAQNQDLSARVWADAVLRTTSQWPTVTYLKVILASCGTNPEIK